MRHRQVRDDAVRLVDGELDLGDEGLDALDHGEDIAVCQHHPLWIARGALGEAGVAGGGGVTGKVNRPSYLEILPCRDDWAKAYHIHWQWKIL